MEVLVLEDVGLQEDFEIYYSRFYLPLIQGVEMIKQQQIKQWFWKLKWRVYRRYLNRFHFVRGGCIHHRADMSIKYVTVKLRILGIEMVV